MPETIKANIVDIFAESIYPGSIDIDNGIITAIKRSGDKPNPAKPCMIPGFTDAHVHIESSLLSPQAFARMAVVHGTIATVSDPHEIANVAGMKGVRWMLENAKGSPFHFCFGVPSCVPATAFETAGASVSPADVEALFAEDGLTYLAEMMNYPGVLNGDPEVWQKINIAKALNKPIDGHAPGLRGDDALKYINAGISTDHECFTLEEAQFKAQQGMHILIREGSAARNFEALWPLLHSHPTKVMFCSDDKHPDSLLISHIDALVRRALMHGAPLFDVLRAACYNPAKHYGLPNGMLRVGDKADFLLTENLLNPARFRVLQTRIAGKIVSENGVSRLPFTKPLHINSFNCEPIKPADIVVKAEKPGASVKVIKAEEGQLITGLELHKLPEKNGRIYSDSENDILKIVVINRYSPAPPAIAFVRGFGLKEGALASTVAHDSHNIIAVGVSDEAITEAVNMVIGSKGGLAAWSENEKLLLPLPIAGLMSDGEGKEIAAAYTAIDALSKKLGSTTGSPFMTLSFMALLVIPRLKLSDKGLFDGESFKFVHLQE
ncbi:MAG: adenine deaminase [Bacteroidota bacterium]